MTDHKLISLEGKFIDWLEYFTDWGVYLNMCVIGFDLDVKNVKLIMRDEYLARS